MTSSDNSRRSESPWLLFHAAAFPTTGLILCPLWKSRSLALRSPLAQPLPTAGGHREHREPLPAPLTLAPGLVRLNWARAFVHIYQQSEEKSRFRWSSSPPALELLSRTQRHIGVFTSARGGGRSVSAVFKRGWKEFGFTDVVLSHVGTRSRPRTHVQICTFTGREV